MEDDKILVILLDLETTGLSPNAEILQLAAKVNDQTFNLYVYPNGPISEESTALHGITTDFDDLVCRGRTVEYVTMKTALVQFANWLGSFKAKCCIAVYNLTFNGPKLWREIKQEGLPELFDDVIHGFVDILDVLRKVTNRERPNGYKFLTLADDFGISTDDCHNALVDCQILSEVLREMSITDSILLQHLMLFEERKNHWDKLEETRIIGSTLLRLKSVVGDSIVKKFAQERIKMSDLIDTYNNTGEEGLRQMILSNERLKTLRKSSIENIIGYFRDGNHVIELSYDDDILDEVFN